MVVIKLFLCTSSLYDFADYGSAHIDAMLGAGQLTH